MADLYLRSRVRPDAVDIAVVGEVTVRTTSRVREALTPHRSLVSRVRLRGCTCIDLDGVISQLKKPGQTYADLEPMPGAIEKLRALREAGHVIIINTARHMKTTGGNTGAAIARIGQMTLDWLARHGVGYDEIHFGKPWADVYIDDNALRFSDWAAIDGSGANLPVCNEKKQAEQGDK